MTADNTPVPPAPSPHDLAKLLPPVLPDRAVCTCGRSIFPTIPEDIGPEARVNILLDAHRIHKAERKEAGR